MTELTVTATDIPGLLLIDLPVHGDARGWFKENWQRGKMLAAGLPDFGPVQQNVSYNDVAGTTRGIHAEPWDKLVSVATGRVFCAWVDVREGNGFGRVVTAELGPDRAAFVPRGVGNSYQTLESQTAYAYLVNEHWTPDAEYTLVSYADPALGITWPLEPTEVSDKDRAHPPLSDITPVAPLRTVVLGANGQLGRALQRVIPDAEFWSREQADLSSPESLTALDWSRFDTIINAAAYTAVDAAETDRTTAWTVNVAATTELAKIATARRLTLVTISSDYVFDGTAEQHERTEPVSPLGVYGATKAAAEAVTSTVPRHYIVRTSWVVGDGSNFVATMRRLAQNGVSPSVVDDQFGRLTPADDLARGIVDLLDSEAEYGIHHITGSGPIESWADIARRVFAEEGRDPADVTGVSTEEYAAAQAAAGKTLAPRPRHSTL